MKFRELITKIYSEITKVKVGDKVKLVKGGYVLKNGKIYTVLETYPINKVNGYKQTIVVYEEDEIPEMRKQAVSRNRFKKVWF